MLKIYLFKSGLLLRIIIYIKLYVKNSLLIITKFIKTDIFREF